MVPLQVELTGGGPLAILVTVLVGSVFYAVTLHLAATFFIGDVPSQRAAYVGPILAVLSVLVSETTALAPVGAGPTILITLVVVFVADVVAIRYSYRLRTSSAVPLALLHLGFAVVLGLALSNIIGFL